MERSALAERIGKKEQQIAKLGKKIAKLEAKVKSQAALGVARMCECDCDSEEYASSVVPAYKAARKGMGYDEGWDFDDLCHSYGELFRAKSTLAGYKAKLAEADAFASEEKVKPVWDFVNMWMETERKYLEGNAERYFELKKGEKEAFLEYAKANKVDLGSNNAAHSACYDFIKGNGWDARPYYWAIDPLVSANVRFKTRAVAEYGDEDYKEKTVHGLYAREAVGYELDGAAVEKALLKERDMKYKDFLDKVRKVAGDILDAEGLHIGEKGNVCGVVRGTKANAYVETIGAEGPIIRFHFRVIVKAPKSLNPSRGA